jgi:hypothetical protein
LDFLFARFLKRLPHISSHGNSTPK